MPRVYSIIFSNVSVSAAQDLVQVKGATGKTVRILRQWVSATDTSIPTSQMFYGRSRFLPATVTDGSGGTTPTPRPLDPGDAAASCTGLVNNTTPASSSGTATVLETWGCHAYSGYDYAFPRPPVIGPSESFTFELLSTVSGTVHLSGGVLAEESGG